MWKNQKGQTIVLFTLLIPLFMGALGFGIDIGYIVVQKHKLQNTVDLVALGASQDVTINKGQVISTAIDIAKVNGVSASELKINFPYAGNNNKVEVEATRKVNLFFLPILGFSDKTITVRAVAEKKQKTIIATTSKVFEYAVFSGSANSTMTMRGNGSTITGHLHSNDSVRIMGNDHVIDGNVTAPNGVQKFNTNVKGSVNGSSPQVPMVQVDFNAYAAQARKTYNTSQHFQDTTIEGITVVNGDVQINGGAVKGKGILLVTGNLQISGQGLKYQSSDSMLAIYVKGNVQITATGTVIDGVLYAPNGNIKIAGSGNKFNGALIGNSVEWAGNDIAISGKYDLRTPSSFTILEDYNVLIE
jgi:Flp pilus assembly protein TadG